jgi:hypothetical protein
VRQDKSLSHHCLPTETARAVAVVMPMMTMMVLTLLGALLELVVWCVFAGCW